MKMECRGICLKYKTQKLTVESKGNSKPKRCQNCHIYMKYDGNSCPCCSHILKKVFIGVKSIEKLQGQRSLSYESLSQRLRVQHMKNKRTGLHQRGTVIPMEAYSEPPINKTKFKKLIKTFQEVKIKMDAEKLDVNKKNTRDQIKAINITHASEQMKNFMKKERLIKKLKTFEESKSCCLTCDQKIPITHRKKQINQIKNKIEEINKILDDLIKVQDISDATNKLLYRNEKKYLTFKEARSYVRKLKLKSVQEWREYTKSGKCPDDIPKSPQMVYRDNPRMYNLQKDNTSWTSWRDWLDIPVIKYRTYEESKEFVAKLGINSIRQWMELVQSETLPPDIPKHPHIAYREISSSSGMIIKKRTWISWSDFLNKDEAFAFVKGKERPSLINFKDF
jgi:hypothetical protein